jgi:hypothetical protein
MGRDTKAAKLRSRTFASIEIPRRPFPAVIPEPDGRILVTLVNAGSEVVRLQMTSDLGWRLVACLVETLKEADTIKSATYTPLDGEQ